MRKGSETAPLFYTVSPGLHGGYMRIVLIALASLLLSPPAAAQPTTSKGKSDTAPGQTGKTPGQPQQKDTKKTGKDFAPGQNQKKPGDAKNINPGSTQRK